MFTHIMAGCSDAQKSKAFYDSALGALGIPAGTLMNNRVFYAHDGGAFGVGQPANGAAPSAANGGTIGFKGHSKEEIDAFHAGGLANGGSDEGAPGVRPGAPGKAYGAYLRDPDGNKICAFTQLAE